MGTLNEGDDGVDREDPWGSWRKARPEPSGLHLDSAAAGRSSLGVLGAVADHALLEAKVGAYVAQEMAEESLGAARTALARLLGMPEEGVAFVESATAALDALLQAWPFEPDATLAVVPSEWGPNLAAFVRRGLRLVELQVDADGCLDLSELDRFLQEAPPAAVHITQVASHRTLVQPVADTAGLCRAVEVPLFVDAAQALGHVDTATGADVIYGTSRKWLTGPRGVGVLGVASQWFDLLRSRLVATAPGTAGEPVGTLLSSRESHVAGRLGLGMAAREHLVLGPSAVWARLADVGQATRRVCDDLANWQVIGPIDGPSAITALRPTEGQDVMQARSRLLHEHGIVTTGQEPFRAPRDMTSPTLRVSPHVDCTAEDLIRLRNALAAI